MSIMVCAAEFAERDVFPRSALNRRQIGAGSGKHASARPRSGLGLGLLEPAAQAAGEFGHQL